VSDAMDSAEQWAARHFGQVDLKDKRLNRRAVKVARQMAENPSASIPDQCGGHWGDIKAIYRLLADPYATFERMAQCHWQQTREAAASTAAGGGGVVLFVQDTTWLSYGHHPHTRGLGRHGRGKNKRDRGLHLHNVLAVKPLEQPTHQPGQQPQAEVLGLAYAQLWARPQQLLNADQAARSRRRKSPDRESLRWSRAVAEVGAAPPGCRYLHVGDREADLYELYEQTMALSGVGFVIRGKHDRCALLGHDTPEVVGTRDIKGSGLKKLVRSLPATAGLSLEIDGHNGRCARTAELKISYSPVTLYSPMVRGRRQKALRCWCVRVFEPNAPQGTQPLEWVLLTSEPVKNAEDALRIVRYYHWRWLIEEYHRCLKSGCCVEHSQLQSRQSLEPLVGMLSVVATRLLQLKNESRIHPRALAIEHAAPEMVQMLCRLTGQHAETLSLREFVCGVAKQGGFIGRKGDGEPGWLTLWRGWQKLLYRCEGYRMAQSAGDVGKG